MASKSTSRSAVLEVNDLNFDDEVLKSPLPVFVDVSARWCAPCKAAKPVVEGLAERYHGRLKIVEVDGGESPDIAARLSIRGFPTFVGIVGGAVVERLAGFSGSQALDAMANRLVSSVHD